MRKLVIMIMCIQFGMCIMYSLSIVDFFLTAITIPLSMVSIKYLSIKRSPMTVFLLIYLFCSFSVVALTKFYPLHFSYSSSKVVDKDFVVMASYSVKVMFVTFLSIILANQFVKNKIVTWRYDTFIRPTYIRINLLILFLISLGAISIVVGIGKMGQVNTRLPFHLAGIIQFIRVEVAPFLALLFYMSIRKERDYTGNNDKMRYFLFMFFMWTFFETYVRMSKSAIAYEFLPILIYEVIENSNAGTLKRLFVKLLPFTFVLLAVYSIVENSRNSDGITFDVEEESTATYNNHSANNPFVRPYTRFFINGHHFLTSYQVVNQDAIFDFSNLPAVLVMGGAARYKTFEIDGYPLGVAHSSGSTYIIDALMCGGYGFSYIFLLILVFICVKVDQLISSSIPLISALVLALLLFKYITAGLSVSIIVDPMAKNGILITLFLLFIFNRIKTLPEQ